MDQGKNFYSLYIVLLEANGVALCFLLSCILHFLPSTSLAAIFWTFCSILVLESGSPDSSVFE